MLNYRQDHNALRLIRQQLAEFEGICETARLGEHPWVGGYPDHRTQDLRRHAVARIAIHHVIHIVFAAQQLVTEFLETFKEFAPRQKAASFTIDQAFEKIAAAASGR